MTSTATRLRSEDLVDLGRAAGLSTPAGVRAPRVPIAAAASGSARLAQVAEHPVLVMEGVVLRSLQIGRRTSALLHGPGDVLAGSDFEPPPFEVASRALEPSAVVVLDPRTLAALAAVPALAARIAAAVDAQAARLGLQALLAQLTSIAERLDVLLPVLAERWGTVTADGVLLPSFLSHTVLAELIGVRRPSLTTALSEIESRGALRRLADRRWLLSPAAAGLAA